MEIWSSSFLSEHPDWATCSVNIDAWTRITEENEGAGRIIGQISIGEKVAYCPLGAPYYTQEGGAHAGPDGRREDEKLYLPAWALARLEVEGCGEEAEVEWLTDDAFPEATRIVVRPHDPAFFHGDAKEDLERTFTRLGVLQVGMTVAVPLQELGGYEVPVDIVTLEPAQIVLAHGDEVAIEFQEPVAAPTVAAPPAAAAPESFDTTFPAQPDSWIAAGEGRTTGGTVRRLADGRPWNPWRDGPLPTHPPRAV